jgi:hypothetical protein
LRFFALFELLHHAAAAGASSGEYIFLSFCLPVMFWLTFPTLLCSVFVSDKIIGFWSEVKNVCTNGNKWTLGNNATWIGDVKDMYVRDCYVTLANRLLEVEGGVKIALILGAKGIGKTMFLNYLIIRILQKEQHSNPSIV